MSRYQWEDGGDASNPEEPVEAPQILTIPLKHKKTIIEDDITTDSWPHHSMKPEEPVEAPLNIPLERKKTIIEDDITTDSLPLHEAATVLL
jgi:hypothetical protein